MPPCFWLSCSSLVSRASHPSICHSQYQCWGWPGYKPRVYRSYTLPQTTPTSNLQDSQTIEMCTFIHSSHSTHTYSPSSSFSSGFSSADIELSLPAGVTVASLAWVGVCDDSSPSPVLASVVVLPQLVSNVPCNTTLIGELPGDSNNISGRVYLLDRITFAVLGFSYDGLAAGWHLSTL